MLDAAFWLAAVLALVGALTGNRVAWPLLASFAFCQIARWRDWAFDENLWATVDLAALIGVGIILGWEWIGKGRKITASDTAIVLLFAPMLGSYGLDDPWRYLLSNGVNIAQLLLVFPAVHFWHCLRSARRRTRNDPWKDFDLRVSA